MIACAVRVNDAAERAMKGGDVRMRRLLLRRPSGPSVPPDAVVVAGHSVAFRSLIERLPVVVYIDLPASEYTSVYVSPNAEELFGYPVEEWRQPGFFRSILHPDDHDAVMGSQNYKRAGTQSTEEYRVITRAGAELWVRDTFLVVGGSDGRPLYVSGLLEDITDRKRAEQHAVSSERRFRAILEDMSLSAALLDVDGRITFCN